MKFKSENTLLYFLPNKKILLDKKYTKLASFDLDHTLIKPKDNRVHPKSIDDFELVFENIIDKLTELYKQNYNIVIFSNQSDLLSIEKQEKKKIVLGRIEKLIDLLGFEISIFISTQKNIFRKPNLGMLDFFIEKTNIKLDYKNSYYVGDAGGRIKTKQGKKDFACSDRMFAINANLKFYTPEEFFIENYNENIKYVCINKAETLFLNGKNLELEISKQEDKIKKIIKNNIIFFQGPPASGKSYLSNRLEKLGYNIISQDRLGTKAKVISEFKKLLKDMNNKIVLDNTNGSKKYRNSFTEILNKQNREYVLINIDISKEQSFFLNNYRSKVQNITALPDVAIHSYFKRLEKINKDEGFMEIYQLQFLPKFKNVKEKELFYQFF